LFDCDALGLVVIGATNRTEPPATALIPIVTAFDPAAHGNV